MSLQMANFEFFFHICGNFRTSLQVDTLKCIDEYSMMSHRQGNAKLEYMAFQGAIVHDYW